MWEAFMHEWEGIKRLIFSLISFALLYVADSRLGLKSLLGEPSALVIYGVATVLLYIPVVYLAGNRIARKVQISSAQPIETEILYLPSGKAVFVYYCGLDIEIPSGWEITDCYVTLERSIPVYYEDRVLLPKDTTEDIFNRIRPIYRVLAWETPLTPSYKITIGDNSNRETILVGKIKVGKSSPDAFKEEIVGFEHCYFGRKQDVFYPTRLGLYKISLVFHWKYRGIKMSDKRFDGYIYSEYQNSIARMRIGRGDHRKDDSIPKPRLRRAVKVDETETTVENSGPSKTKKTVARKPTSRSRKKVSNKTHI
jgi:hypothetical protein